MCLVDLAVVMVILAVGCCSQTESAVMNNVFMTSAAEIWSEASGEFSAKWQGSAGLWPSHANCGPWQLLLFQIKSVSQLVRSFVLWGHCGKAFGSWGEAPTSIAQKRCCRNA